MPFNKLNAITPQSTTIFERRESEVRGYSRSFPVKFTTANGAKLTDVDGRQYIDFLSGCSSLNYGHNHPVLKKALQAYIEQDGLAHSLDMETDAKEGFLEEFEKTILKPRQLDYVVQFTGPTGANAVEAALKLARKVTGRTNIIAFTNGFHGCTLGALALTGNAHHRGGSGLPLTGVTRMPYEGYYGADTDTLSQIDMLLSDASGGIDAPAAFIVEAVQGEGGLNAASSEWLQGLEALARKHGALLIIDDIQAGVGRTGTFFSFEKMGITPDIVTLAKSLSGYGLPMALTLMRRELDIWKPGEHNGTFRGNCHAFVTATAALKEFWQDNTFQKAIDSKAGILQDALKSIAEKYDEIAGIKGRGMMYGLDVKSGEVASEIVQKCFENGLIIETAGADDEIVKCLTPLNIENDTLLAGLKILADSVDDIFAKQTKNAA